MTSERLSKILARAGVASRRAAEVLIFDGKVTVNGEIVLVPQTPVDPNIDIIRVEGKKIPKGLPVLYYALHKPIGYHCTNDLRVSRRAVSLIATPPGVRLFTVGRLDRDTSGLIIVTNDGHFAHRIMHPSGGIKKEYIAKVDREVTSEHLKKLSEGCVVDGTHVRPVRVAKVRRGTVRVTVQEGRRHEVREIIAAAGLTVIELKRIRVGGVLLGTLPPGEYRMITPEEVLGTQLTSHE